MTVFIAHAPQDIETAKVLGQAFYDRGFQVELETGEGAMQPLSASDSVVGLISKDFVFSPYKLRLEKRLLDAWADGQLILVKLDQAFAPIGLRDLPAIDASFEAQRDLAWTQVVGAFEQLRATGGPQDSLERSRSTGSIDVDMGAPREEYASAPPPPMAPAPDPQTPGSSGGAARKRMAQKRGGAGGFLIFLLALAGAAAAYFFSLTRQSAPDSSTTPFPVDVTGATGIPEAIWRPVLIGGAIALGLLLMALVAISAARKAALERALGKPSKKDKKAREITLNQRSPAEAAPATRAPAPEPAEPLVFISYARADQNSVDPLAKAVKDSGHAVWIDSDAINAGTSWAGEIVRAIKSAGHVLIMCSPRSFESDQVKREVYLADRYKKPLMPVFLEAAEPPEDFEYFFAGVQWLKLHEAPEADRPAILARALPAA